MRYVLVPSLIMFFGAKDAVAQVPERRAFRVDVALPPECTESFADELRAKTKNVELVGPTDPAPSLLRVRVTKGRAAFDGRLDIEIAGATPVQRVLRAETCAEVVRGLTLVAAVTIDPPAAPSEPGAEAPPGSAETPPPPTEIREPLPTKTPPPTPESRFSIAVGGSTEVSALAPDAVLLLGGLGELGTTGGGPRVRLRFGASLPAGAASRSGNASLAWLAGTTDVCPLGFGLGAGLFVRPCLGVTLGSLGVRGGGAGVALGETRSRFWAAGRIAAGLDGDVGPFTFGASVGALLPITREQLVFRPAPGVSGPVEPVYQPPVAAAFGSIDVGVRFR